MKQIAPPFIKQETFDKLKLKEKAYLIFLYQKKYSKKQLMQKLYIDSNRSFQRLQKKMGVIIKNDKMTQSKENRLKK